MLCTRRSFTTGLTAAVAFPALAARAMEVRGVHLGLQTYTFHNVQAGGMAAVDSIIAATRKLDVDLCELWSPQVEPFPLPYGYWGRFAPGSTLPAKPTPEDVQQQREARRAWRLGSAPRDMETVREKFKAAGIRLFAYNYTFEPTMTDAEVESGFLQAKALGVNLITASSKVSTAQRVVPFAAEHNMRVAFHGHASKDPGEVSSPGSFAAVLAMSPLYRVNLDIAHFASAGYDSVAFLKANHDKITNLHVHDRLLNDGASVPLGEGVAPAREILLLVRDRGWKIPVFYELEYAGADGRDVIAETARELAYERRVLAS